jgi:hypothetical protein
VVTDDDGIALYLKKVMTIPYYNFGFRVTKIVGNWKAYQKLIKLVCPTFPRQILLSLNPLKNTAVKGERLITSGVLLHVMQSSLGKIRYLD